MKYSWGSGANPWGPEKEDQFSKPNHYDGMLEIVGVTGVVHMGQIQSGLRSAVRIAQGGHVRILVFSQIALINSFIDSFTNSFIDSFIRIKKTKYKSNLIIFKY